MTAPIRFTSGRQQQQKIGVTGDTDNKKVLEVVGRAGIGTTIFEPSTSLDVRGDVNVSGSITATSFDGSFVGTIDSTNIVGASLSISGISTLGITTATDLTLQQLNVSGISTLGITTATDLTLQQLNVSGISTLGVTTLTNVTAQQLNVSGIATLGVTTATDLTLQQLNVSGISTLGVTTLTNVTAQQLNVSGISTFSSRLQIDANVGIGTTNPTGIVTSTNTTVLHVGVVTANYYYGDGTNLIMTDSIGLGTDTHGDYVKSISGTANEIKVTGGTGEGSTPTIGFEDNPTISGNVTIGTDLQVNNNLNVTGSITIGGSAAFLDSETLRVQDADIVLGFTTNSNNDDVSTDTTASHGGIAIASTEGNPLVTLAIAGIETLPATYKKIMWFKAGSFAGLNTDAWLSNYAIGIGSTQFPAGTRLAAGSVQFSENDLSVVRNINASGIITATSGFSGTLTGSLTGTATTANNVNRTVSAGLGLTGGGTLTDNITVHVGIGTTAGLERADDEIRLKNYNNLINNNILTWDTTGGVGQISTSQISDDGTNVTIGSGITFYVSSGVVSATSYYGSGGNLEDIIKGKIEGINALDSEGTYVGTGFSFSALQFTDNRVSVTGIGTTLQIALGTPGYATTAGFATDLTAGTAGDIPYQTDANSTSFLNIGAEGQVLLVSPGGLPVWGPVTDASSALGISVEDNLTNVGGASSVTTINFGTNLGVTSSTSEVGLVTVTVSDTPSFTLVSVSSSIGIGTTNPLQALQVGTANTLGFTTDGTAVVVTGIGSVGVGTISPRYNLDVLGDINLDGTFYQNGTQFVASRWTTGIGDSIYRLSSVGIGTTNPEATLDVKGDLKVGTAITASAGVITATKFVTSGATSSDFIKGDGSTDSNTYLTAESDTIDTVLGRGNSTTKGVQITGISTLGVTTATDVTAQQLNVSGISTFKNDIVLSGIGKSIKIGPTQDQLSLEYDNLGLGLIRQNSGLYALSPSITLGNFNATLISATFTPTTGVGLYYNNNLKLQTLNNGIDVTGHVETDSLNVSGISTLGVTTATDLTAQQLNVSGIATVGKIVTNPTPPSSGITTLALFGENGETEKIIIESDGDSGSRVPYFTNVVTNSNLYFSPRNGVTITNYAGNLTSFEAFVDGEVRLYYCTALTSSQKFNTYASGVQVYGNIEFDSSGGTIDAAGSGVVTYYGDGSNLTGIAAGGDGADFNTGLTTTAYASASDNIDGFTAIGVTFPTTAGKRYLVTSMHITNVSPSDLYLTSRIDYNSGQNVPLTNRVIIPYQGSLEIVDESFITNPSDNLRFAAFTGIGTDAGGVTNGLDCWVTYETKDDTNYIGIGSTVPTTGNHTVFTSNTNPSTINTINLTNYSNFVDVDASVSIYRGGTIRQGYLAYNLTIPQNSTVQILPRAKRLNASDTIVVNAGIGSALSVNIAGKYIT